VLYQLLLPYAERCILLGPAIGCLGPVSFPLGLLATTLRRWDEAQAHFEGALRQNIRLGARPFVAQTQYEYARMLIARAHTGDADHARLLLEQALATAQELGMVGLEEKINASQGKSQASPRQVQDKADQADSSLPAPSPQPPTPTFRYENDVWTITYQGTTFHLKNVRGLRYIAHLLRNPYKKFHALDLVAMTLEEATEQSVEEQAVQPETAIPSHLRDAYRQQLNDLQDELEEAREFHDIERAARAQEEIDRLVQQLATEMRGDKQNRKAAARAERARINVLKGITSALTKIAVHSLALELYLSTTLKTGVFCTYTPDPHMPVPWQL
jgi:hypothetical protein